MTAALLLAWYGVESLLVEKHVTVSHLPRARGVHARAMEIVR
jgi:putative polyketide hydroxylase